MSRLIRKFYRRFFRKDVAKITSVFTKMDAELAKVSEDFKEEADELSRAALACQVAATARSLEASRADVARHKISGLMV